MSLAAEFERAFRLHQQGKLREAFLRYDAVLAGRSAATRRRCITRASCCHQAGKHAEAAERIRASLGIDPTSPMHGRISRWRWTPSDAARPRSTR